MKKLLVLLLVLATAALTFTACVTTPPAEVKTEVTLDAQGGTLESTTLTATKGASYTLPTPEKTGYTFDGWYLGETKVESTGTWSYDDTALALLAKWTAKATTITLEGIDAPVTATFGAAYTLPTPEKTGYNFDGWYNGETKVESTGTWATDVATLALTAKWTAKTTAITLEGVETPVTVTFDAAYELPTPEKTGYTFAGWFDADDNQVALTGTWTTDVAEIALTAKWSQKVTTVTLVNGDKTETKLFAYGDAYTLDELTKTGYTFDGWLDADGNVVALTGTWANDAAEVTFTAKWTAKGTKVTLDANGGTVAGETTLTITYGAEYTLVAPTKEGFDFLGWKTADGKAVALTGTWTFEDAEITLVATWGTATTPDDDPGDTSDPEVEDNIDKDGWT